MESEQVDHYLNTIQADREGEGGDGRARCASAGARIVVCLCVFIAWLSRLIGVIGQKT